MQDLGIFSIASQRTRWLAASGATFASNIANADTPGYTARDVTSFEAALSNRQAVDVTDHDGSHVARCRRDACLRNHRA